MLWHRESEDICIELTISRENTDAYVLFKILHVIALSVSA